MAASGPFLLLLVGLGVAHLLVLVVLYGRGTATDGRGDAPGEERVEELFDSGPVVDAPDRDLADVVTTPCPECHAINDAGYTFCRRCVAKLSR